MLTTFRDSLIIAIQQRPRTRTLKQISNDTKIPEGWLKMFAQGKVENPCGNRMETLYTNLTGNTLKLKF